MNEEDIRGKLILPYLKDLGFDVSEISLERAFTIRLGKKKYITGRSDILCKRHNKNLFIIELKNDSISITQDDIDQGISYATSLLDGIAPFTIVTNGKTTRVFDSISRKELSGNKISEQSSFWKNGYTLSSDEELRIRYEALKNFIALSPENLKIFCESQVQDRMGQIIGSIENPYSKFVKELHVQRKSLQTTFKDFLSSEESIFGLVGSAGVGKTSAICSLALQNLDDKFVFFYNAAIIKSPLECISQDLNIVFSSRSETDIVLKKLDELGRYTNKSVLIFIDAIDESINPYISIELSEIALAAKNLDKVKVIISCKSNIWNSILKNNNTPTHLFEELNKFHDPVKNMNGCPGFLLNDFTDEELKGIIPLYQKAFGFKGVISNSLLKELRNGFFLKIFSEVYSYRPIPEKIDDKELIKKYLEQTLQKSNIDNLIGIRILSKIGKTLLNHNYSSLEAHLDEGLDADNLLEKLDFAIDENLPEDLFSRNILIKSNKDDSYNISFYYSKIRDYIICFHTSKLDKLNNEEFYKALSDFYQNYIGRSALAFYVENASSSHLNTLKKFKKDKALQYVVDYESFIQYNFKNFKEKFNPETEGDIGILLPDDLINKDGYALFPLDLNSENRIQYHSLVDPFSSGRGKDLYFEKGVKTIYGSNSSLLVSDQSNIIKKNIYDQLKDIVEKGRISSYNSDILLLEKISTILYIYYKKLNYDYEIEDFYLPRFNLIYPIDLENLKERLYKFKVAYYFKRKNVDRSLINGMVEDAFENKMEIPKLNTIGDFPPFEELFKIVDILLKRGYRNIKQHHLPCPNKSIQEVKAFQKQNREQKKEFNIRLIRNYQFDEYNAKLYIEKFFKYLETCYKDFVDYLFPTLKDDFPFYKSIPHEYFFYMKDLDVLKWGSFGYRTSLTGKTQFNFKNIDQSNEAFEKENLTSLRAFSLDFILHINDDYVRYPVQTVDHINTEEVDELCVIRNWVYKLLEDDMEGLFKDNDH